jgi:hypothetical protein
MLSAPYRSRYRSGCYLLNEKVTFLLDYKKVIEAVVLSENGKDVEVSDRGREENLKEIVYLSFSTGGETD